MFLFYNYLNSSSHLYADDLQIYFQAVHLLIGVVADLARVSDWSNIIFGLTVNPNKMQLTIVGSTRMMSRINWSTLPRASFDDILFILVKLSRA